MLASRATTRLALLRAQPLSTAVRAEGINRAPDCMLPPLGQLLVDRPEVGQFNPPKRSAARKQKVHLEAARCFVMAPPRRASRRVM